MASVLCAIAVVLDEIVDGMRIVVFGPDMIGMSAVQLRQPVKVSQP